MELLGYNLNGYTVLKKQPINKQTEILALVEKCQMDGQDWMARIYGSHTQGYDVKISRLSLSSAFWSLLFYWREFWKFYSNKRRHQFWRKLEGFFSSAISAFPDIMFLDVKERNTILLVGEYKRCWPVHLEALDWGSNIKGFMYMSCLAWSYLAFSSPSTKDVYPSDLHPPNLSFEILN